MKASQAGEGSMQKVPIGVVLPFYIYAAVFYLISCVLLFISTESLSGHHFQPGILAITHSMALGWGTMMILGASYQLIPVLIESKLQSSLIAKISFVLAALGIPFLVYGFHTFQLGWVAQVGGIAINLAVILYVINLAWSVSKSKRDNIHAIFVFTASCWLMLTTLWGLLLLFNFTMDLFPQDSLYYLPSHAHMGIVGWFLLLVLGVGSRLIPMFLISKFTHENLLWLIYGLINLGLILYILKELNPHLPDLGVPATALIALGLLLFIYYCWKAYQQRIRKKTDPQMKISLAAIGMILIPLLVLIVLINNAETVNHGRLVMAYGFCVFFGWLTAIILGMTFKTLPFIVWTEVYRYYSSKNKTPDPKDLFSSSLFHAMWIFYGLGFLGLLYGVLAQIDILLPWAAGSMIFSAALYVWNVFKVIFHKPQKV